MELNLLSRDDGITHVAPKGRLDTAAAREFESEFLAHTAAQKKPVLIDLSGLTFLSSMGIRMMLSAAIELNRHGAKIALLNLPPLAEKAVIAAGLDMVMHVAHDEQEAVEFLKRHPSATETSS